MTTKTACRPSGMSYGLVCGFPAVGPSLGKAASAVCGKEGIPRAAGNTKDNSEGDHVIPRSDTRNIFKVH